MEREDLKGGNNRAMFLPGASYLAIKFSHDKCTETTTFLKLKYLFKRMYEKHAKW